MFINLTNHPSSGWGRDQYEAAAGYGSVIDLAFPDVNPELTSGQVASLASDYYNRILDLAAAQGEPLQEVTVMVSGEFSFTYHLVNLLKENNVHCVCACTKRESREQLQPDGSIVKTARFAFVQFREY